MHPLLTGWGLGRDHIGPLLVAFSNHKPLNRLVRFKVEPVADLLLIFLHEALGWYTHTRRPVLLPASLLD